MTDHLESLPFTMSEARIMGKNLDEQWPREHLLGAYVLMAKLEAEVSDVERRELRGYEQRALDLIREMDGGYPA